MTPEHRHEWRVGHDTCVYDGCDASWRDHHPKFVCPSCGAESWHPDDLANSYCGRCHKFFDGLAERHPILNAIAESPAVAEKLKDWAMELDGVMPGHACVSLSAVMKHSYDKWVTITVRHAALMSDSADGWDVLIEPGEL